MADFGFGPYAWLKDAADESEYVGINIANSHTGMTEFDIKDSLQKDFDHWIGLFERGALDNPGFPWTSFHKEGLALSRRLKEEIGEAANVVYVKPYEDPDHEKNEKTWIISKAEEREAARTHPKERAIVRPKKKHDGF